MFHVLAQMCCINGAIMNHLSRLPAVDTFRFPFFARHSIYIKGAGKVGRVGRIAEMTKYFALLNTKKVNYITFLYFK